MTERLNDSKVPGGLKLRMDSLEKTPMLGKIEGGRRRGQRDEMVG